MLRLLRSGHGTMVTGLDGQTIEKHHRVREYGSHRRLRCLDFVRPEIEFFGNQHCQSRVDALPHFRSGDGNIYRTIFCNREPSPKDPSPGCARSLKPPSLLNFLLIKPTPTAKPPPTAAAEINRNRRRLFTLFLPRFLKSRPPSPYQRRL
jgi:hypothetical protein